MSQLVPEDPKTYTITYSKKLKITHKATIRDSSNKALRHNSSSNWQDYGVNFEQFKAHVLRQKVEGVYDEKPRLYRILSRYRIEIWPNYWQRSVIKHTGFNLKNY
jgi:hypothetical protein